MQKKQAIILVAALLVAGIGIFAYVRTVGTPQAPTNTNKPGTAVPGDTADFGEGEAIEVGQTARWEDGLTARLERIDDSRCQPGVVCIWQGELSAVFTISGGTVGAAPRELRLGTETAPRVAMSGYAFTLESATTASVKLSVEKLVAAAPGPKDDLIRVSVPIAGAVVESPLVIEGEARGTWYFEASFPVQLLDANGKVIASHYAQALGEWMTTEFVPFSSTIEFAAPTTATGTLVLSKDNPSGLPEHDDEIRIPVRFTVPLGDCKPTGCSGQVCSDEDVMTTCEYREEYACYKDAECARQFDGECGWTPTPGLTSCLAGARQAPSLQ